MTGHVLLQSIWAVFYVCSMRLAAAITRPQSHRKFVGNTQKNVAKHNPATCDDLWTCTKQELESIDNGTITKLYESMPKRIKAVLKLKGQSIKY